MKIITPILLICIYFLSLCTPVFNALNRFDNGQFVAATATIKEPDKNKQFYTGFHAFKLKDAHLAPVFAKVAKTQTGRLPQSILYASVLPYVKLNTGGNIHSSASNGKVPPYLYGCVLRL